MRRRILTAALALLLLCGGCAGAPQPREEGLSVVASFYPVWVMAANVLEGVEGVRLTLLTEQDTGCLHHYQLQPQDMKTLDGADLLLLNGAGMEGFIEEAAASFGDLTLVDTSAALELIESCGHSHTHGHTEGEGEHQHSVNPHVWLDVDNAIAQTRAIAEAVKPRLPGQEDKLEANTRAYIDRLTALKGEMQEALSALEGVKLVTGHDAFAYFARAFSLEVAAVIQQDEESEPSAAQIGEICTLMEQEGIPAVFMEPDSSSSAAETIARETGAQLRTLDPLTRGELDREAYERVQRQNAQVLVEVFS